ncbi:hypothetical protein [Sphingomonas azotifigens]|uniref:hypothetical protein n=1 Tax=Sphingomonas azotifigens TaxID=330920 RepID=UPI000A020340|nr:hypothetical protein [Sphingomonas azotifigens]
MTWLKRFGIDLIGAHVDGVRAIRALPWLFGVLIAWELAQHVVEVRIGFFTSVDAARAVQEDGGRMLLGWIKMLSVYVGGFFVLRQLAGRVNAPIGTAALRYLPYLAYALIAFALIFYAGRWAPDRVDEARAVVALAQIAIEPLLMLWVVSAATDGEVRTPWQSARMLGWRYAYALPLFFVGRIPVNAVHQLLNRYAMGQPPALLWPMLVLDAITVGLIIAVIPAIAVRVARRVREHVASRPALALA